MSSKDSAVAARKKKANFAYRDVPVKVCATCEHAKTRSGEGLTTSQKNMVLFCEKLKFVISWRSRFAVCDHWTPPRGVPFYGN